MHQLPSVSAADFASDCPVSLDLVANLTQARPDAVSDLLDGIPEATRARLAVWLYGRSHTHDLGVRIAATCEGASLRRVAGLVGNVLHDLSRRPHTPPGAGRRRISLGGSQASA